MKALGKHLIIELYRCSTARLNDVEHLEQSMIHAAKSAGATVLNSTFHHFQPLGVSGVVVIQESHFAIHTWPEYSFASLDIFTCGESIDPWIAYHLIKEALEADYGSATEMGRGAFDLLQKQEIEAIAPEAIATAPVVPKFKRDAWFTESHGDIAFSLKHSGKLLHARTSTYQDIKVYDSLKFGPTLVLDDLIMCTEKDEYVYHEMITHVPMLSHPDPKRALIIGGGDGGTARELLKHESLEAVVLVEIDEAVVETAQQFLPTIAVGLNHPKLKLKIADGVEYIYDTPDTAFDLILVDSSDPVGPGTGLFDEAFYKQVYRCLTPNGLLVVQSESPLFHAEVFRSIFQCHQRIFGPDQVHCYLASIPTYPTGLWSFSLAAKGEVHPLKSFDAARAKQFTRQHQLKYYNEAIHQAAFALPSFVREMLGLEAFT